MLLSYVKSLVSFTGKWYTMKKILFFLLFIISTQTFAIMYGKQVPEGKYLSVGALTQFDNVICSGSFISKRHFLTAAHCAEMLVESDMESVRIYLGPGVEQGNIEGGFPISEIFVHPKFQKERSISDLFHHDFAIFKLVDTVDSIVPVELFPTDLVADLLLDQEVTMVGYGIRETHYDSFRSSKGLKFMTANTVALVGESEFKLDEEKAPRPCNIDSGGPAFINYQGKEYQVGVVSRGDMFCSSISIYGMVDVNDEWIQEQLNK